MLNMIQVVLLYLLDQSFKSPILKLKKISESTLVFRVIDSPNELIKYLEYHYIHYSSPLSLIYVNSISTLFTLSNNLVMSLSAEFLNCL